MVVGVIALTGWRPGRTWSLLLAGLSALVIADIAFTLQSTEAALPGGEWINPIYLIAAVCLGAAVWQPAEAAEITSSHEDDRREIVVPAVFAAVMIGLFAMQYYSATGGLSTVLWAATMTRRDRPPDDERPREPQAARGSADRLADRARQPRPHGGRAGGDLRAGQRRATGDALPLRPQRLQALQRHLRPPGRRQAAEPPRHRPESGGRRRRLGLPDRRRRVLPAAHLRRGSLRGGRPRCHRSADRE